MGNVMDHARSVFKKYDKDGNGTPADWLAAVLPAVLAAWLSSLVINICRPARAATSVWLPA
jgi:hypothetical protein